MIEKREGKKEVERERVTFRGSIMWESREACGDHFIVFLISIAFIILQDESWMLPGELGGEMFPHYNRESRPAPTYSIGFLLYL